MQGFVHFHIPLWLRRAVTMLPSFIVIMLGMDATRILVLSRAAQLRHCAGAGAAAGFHRQSGADGEMVNGPVVQNPGKLIVLVVVGLNGYLLIGSVL